MRDRRVRVRRAHHLHPGLAGRVDVLDEVAAPGQEARVFQPAKRLSPEGAAITQPARPSLSAMPYSGRQLLQHAPGGVLDRDAVLAAVALLPELDLAGVVDLVEARGRRRVLQVVGELRHLLLERVQVAEGADLEHGDEAAVVVPPGRFDTETKPGEQAGEDLDDRGEAVALVALAATQRQQRAALAQLARIGGRLAVGIDQPARRHLLAARHRHADLAGGGGRGRHVEEQRAFQVGGHGEADRVGAEPRLGAAERRHVLRAAAGIGGDHCDHAALDGHQRIGGEAADMALAEHRAGGDVLLVRLLDGQPHRLFGDDVAEAPVAVDDGGGRRFPAVMIQGAPGTMWPTLMRSM